MAATEQTLKQGEALILEAFRQARDRGQGNWREMTTAVLKNRMLALTGRSFVERTWDVSSFGRFLELFPQLVDVDHSKQPPVVRLLAESLGERTHAEATTPARLVMTPNRSVRSDLWKAALDFSSGDQHYWADGRVLSIEAGDPVPEGALALPAMTPEVFAQWRTAFVEEHRRSGVESSVTEQLERWRTEGLSSRYLPSALRGLWNAELKRRVLELLSSWFAETGVEPPADLVIDRSARHRAPVAATEELRAFVQASVAAMTRPELESLKLPSSAAFRAVRRRSE